MRSSAPVERAFHIAWMRDILVVAGVIAFIQFWRAPNSVPIGPTAISLFYALLVAMP